MLPWRWSCWPQQTTKQIYVTMPRFLRNMYLFYILRNMYLFFFLEVVSKRHSYIVFSRYIKYNLGKLTQRAHRHDTVRLKLASAVDRSFSVKKIEAANKSHEKKNDSWHMNTKKLDIYISPCIWKLIFFWYNAIQHL